MKTAIHDEKDLIGKTISYVDDEEGLFIGFSDGTYLAIETKYDSSSLTYNDVNINPNHYNYISLFNRGFITEDVYNKVNAEKIEAENSRIDQNRKREIEQLKALKAKYPEV